MEGKAGATNSNKEFEKFMYAKLLLFPYDVGGQLKAGMHLGV